MEAILKDQPISYAYDRPNFYRNRARENAWGIPVFFAPSDRTLDQYGTAGPYYEYGHTYVEKRGYKGNCTWWVIGRIAELTGYVLNECIGDAKDFLKKYNGRVDDKDYIGDTIQEGDVLVFKDNDYGHVIVVEKVEGNTLHISESAYSKKAIYENKACITYTLDKKKMVVGNKVTLRPQAPFSEYLVGVMHTSDLLVNQEETSLKKENKALRERLAKIKELCD